MRFSIERNGENAFELILPLGEGDSTHWHPIEGLERLQENDRIELATEWVGAAPSISPGSMSLGFGRLSLERAARRSRSRAWSATGPSRSPCG